MPLLENKICQGLDGVQSSWKLLELFGKNRKTYMLDCLVEQHRHRCDRSHNLRHRVIGSTGLSTLLKNNPAWATDPDPFDFIDPPDNFVNQRGIIVRTDFTNDSAWNTFLQIIADTEKDGKADLVSSNAMDEDSSSSEEDEEGGEEEVEAAGTKVDEPMQASRSISPTASAFIILDPISPQFPLPQIASSTLTSFTSAPNLTLLRLLTDVDIVSSPTRPQTAPKIKTSNQLVDFNGLHEVYNGRYIWVYDAVSNTNMSVRVLTGRAGVYGTATGDSWRAQARSIWDLQVNLDSGAFNIDFGGEDRYDTTERARNFALLRSS